MPGIPAAIGTACYAGVPLTYPGGGDSVTFVRGHEDESSTPPDVDWASLARLGGTLVCYAGPRQLPEILKALLANGFNENESAAIIYEGTLPTQRTTDGTLRELAEMKNMRTIPAILVVGTRRRACASTCDGSTSGRFSASASSLRARASSPPSWSTCSNRWERSRSRHR